MDGYELALELRRLPSLSSVRLIAVTDYGQAVDRNRALMTGFDDHVTKPVDIGRLSRMLEKQVGCRAGRRGR